MFRKTKPPKESGEFLSDLTVSEAAFNQELIQAKFSPAQKAISDIATEAMQEIESIYDGPKIQDANIVWAKNLAHRAGLEPKELLEALRAVKPGAYFLESFKNEKVYFKTPTGDIQEAGEYVFRIEKSCIHMLKNLEQEQKRGKELQALNKSLLAEQEKLQSAGFWGFIFRAFRTLKRNPHVTG